MKPKPFTKTDLEPQVGLTYFIGTKSNAYEGEIIGVNDETLTIEYFNGVKDQVRELDIPLNEILWIKESV